MTKKMTLAQKVTRLENRCDTHARVIRDLFLCIGGNNLAGQKLLENWSVQERPIDTEKKSPAKKARKK